MQCQPASSLDLFTDSCRLMGDATMIVVMEFDRRLNLGRLETAASRCIDAFPILSSRLVRGHGPAYWEFQERDIKERLVTVETIEERDYRQYIAYPMDPYASAQSKVRLLRTPDRDVVVITMAHAAADGHGLIIMANVLLNAYLDPSSVLRGDGRLPVRDTLWTVDLLDGPAKSDEKTELDLSMWPSLCGKSKEPSTYHRVVIPPEEVLRVKQAVHRCGGTINDVLLSAYFLSISDLTGHYGPQSVSFPVDLRQHLSDGSRIMCNQAGNISFTLQRETGERTGAILTKVVKETKRLKVGRVGVREQVAFDRFCDSEGKAVHKMVQDIVDRQEKGFADIFISNPGQFPLPQVDGLVDAYLCYPGILLPSTCFAVSTFRGYMSVTMGYQNESEPREVTRRALEGFVEHLSVDVSKVRYV